MTAPLARRLLAEGVATGLLVMVVVGSPRSSSRPATPGCSCWRTP